MQPVQSPIMRRRELPAYMKLSLPTIDRLRVAGDFPKAIRLGVQAVGYFKTDIDAWLANRPLTSQFVETI